MPRSYVIDKTTGAVYRPTKQAPGKPPKSGVKGVTRNGNSWQVRTQVFVESEQKLKTVYIGSFATFDEAKEVAEDALQASLPIDSVLYNPMFVPRKMLKELDTLIEKRVLWGVKV